MGRLTTTRATENPYRIIDDGAGGELRDALRLVANKSSKPITGKHAKLLAELAGLGRLETLTVSGESPSHYHHYGVPRHLEQLAREFLNRQ